MDPSGFTGRLLKGEKIIWQGQPAQGLLFTSRRGMNYAVTDKRVLILRSGPFGKFSAIRLDQLQDANLSERPDGRGAIRFGAVAPYWTGRGFSYWTPSLDPTPQFIAIEDARKVFDHIQGAVARGA